MLTKYFIFMLFLFPTAVYAEGGGALVAPAGTPKKSESAAAKAEAVRTRKELLESEISTLNKKKPCDGDGECEALEMGSRHCGGPSEYLIVSNSNPKYAVIKTKVAEFTSVEKELNQVDPPLTCTPAPTEPYAQCIKNECHSGKR